MKTLKRTVALLLAVLIGTGMCAFAEGETIPADRIIRNAKIYTAGPEAYEGVRMK